VGEVVGRVLVRQPRERELDYYDEGKHRKEKDRAIQSHTPAGLVVSTDEVDAEGYVKQMGPYKVASGAMRS
jgi:hypothetical protein